jgi:hypothetical protein
LHYGTPVVRKRIRVHYGMTVNWILNRNRLVKNIIYSNLLIDYDAGYIILQPLRLLFVVTLARVVAGGCFAEVGEMSDPTVPQIRVFSQSNSRIFQ